MLDFVLLAKTLLAATLVAGAVMGLAHRRRPSPWRTNARWSWAVGAGVLVASGIADQWPHCPALEDRARFLTILVPLCLVVETVAACLRSTRAAWLLRLALAAAVAPTLLFNTVYLADLSGPGSAEWSTAEMVMILTGLARAVGDNLGADASLAIALVNGHGAVGAGARCRGNGRHGHAFRLLSRRTARANPGRGNRRRHGGIAVRRQRSTTDGSLGMSVIGIFSVVLVGRYFGALSTGLAACLILAPLLAWTFELPRLCTLPAVVAQRRTFGLRGSCSGRSGGSHIWRICRGVESRDQRSIFGG